MNKFMRRVSLSTERLLNNRKKLWLEYALIGVGMVLSVAVTVNAFNTVFSS